jgi:ribonucleotide reductase beta subunit family protein with ferritin-like domain
LVNFLPMVSGIPEATYFFSFQMFIEAVHGIVYAKQIVETLADIELVKNTMINLNNFAAVQKKEQWVDQWIEKSNSDPDRLLAFLAVEGVGFVGSFAVINYFKLNYPDLCQGLTLANDYIQFDEKTHAMYLVELIRCLKKKYKPTQKRAHEIFASYLEVEKQFCIDAIKEPFIGMTGDKFYQYCQYVADSWLVDCGYEKLSGVENPFSWMKAAELQKRDNFFEKHVSNYTFTGTSAKSLASFIEI